MRFKWKRAILTVTLLLTMINFYYLTFSLEGNIYLPSNQITTKSNSECKHKLAVLVPYRDRFPELLHFVMHMNAYLTQQGVNFHIYILHQVDKLRFNRGSLLNVGFLASRWDQSDYVVLHDVDLLPQHSLHYDKFPSQGPVHLTPPHLHPRYHYETFLGGILLLTRRQFSLVNGLSNVFWGWGREDDEFRLRLLDANLKIQVPAIANNVTNPVLLHNHIAQRQRDTQLTYNQRELTYKRDYYTGVRDVKYRIAGNYLLCVFNSSVAFPCDSEKRDSAVRRSIQVTVLDIFLLCNEAFTPYCKQIANN